MADPEIEHDVKMLTIDDELPAKVEALKAEGWELIQGILPVAIYHVIRKVVREEDDGQPRLRMAVDDSKVLILRNGKPV